MSRFALYKTPIEGLKIVERQQRGDARGFLSRLFCASELAAAGWRKPVAQINHTYTAKEGTVRGMHYQNPPHTEMKLVSCIRGKVWDVAVDLRAGSDTFLYWHAEELSVDNNRALLIPEGCAHGFQALTVDVELLYCHSVAYHAESEAGLNPQDSKLSINWPIEIAELSNRDDRRPMIDHNFAGLVITKPSIFGGGPGKVPPIRRDIE